MSEISDWIDGDQDYHQGVELYRKHGEDRVLLTLFALPETSFTKAKLLQAMEQLAPKEPEPKEEAKEKTPPQVLHLIRKRSQLHETLFHTRSTSDRHTIAKAIMAISSKLDRYYDHGELPTDEAENSEPEAKLPTNAWELHMQINNNIAYIAKNRKTENKQGEVKRRERQNKAIEERLKNINYEPVS
jgi:hypothetical protein